MRTLSTLVGTVTVLGMLWPAPAAATGGDSGGSRSPEQRAAAWSRS